MNAFEIAIYALIVASIVLVCLYPDKPAPRACAIALAGFVALLGITGILTCSRLASEKYTNSTDQSPSGEWMKGSLATRDVVYVTLPLLAASFVGLALLAAIPWRPRASNNSDRT